jgi:hypothetical protein
MRAVVLLLVGACMGCPPTPDPNGPPSPYVIARATIQAGQISVAVADGVFDAYIVGKPDAQAKREAYMKYRAAVLDALSLALDAVNIAETQRKGFDLAALLAPAESTWKDLRAFLNSLGNLRSVPRTIRR